MSLEKFDISGLGLLRVVLAIAVLITHSAYATSMSIPGAIAVKLFFIISGFYMAMILCEKYTNRYRSFYKNRSLRLFPLYITTIGFIFLFGATTAIVRGSSITNSFDIFYAYQNRDIAISTALFLLFSNLSMLFQDVIFFLSPADNGTIMLASKEQMAIVPFYKYLLIPQAWSLSLEITFYLVAPFVVKDIRRIILWMMVSVIVRIVLFIFECNEEQYAYRFFPAEFIFFLMGSLSYHFHQKVKIAFITRYDQYFMAVIILILGGYQLIPIYFELGVRVGLYLAVAALIPYAFNRSKNNAFDNQIGELSYPLYILHMFMYEVLLVIALRVGVNIKGAIFLLVWIVSTLVISYALIRFVQKPFEIIRARTLQR
jgi:peptidoglycan/LPS O-acetylase OafA/YrhL